MSEKYFFTRKGKSKNIQFRLVNPPRLAEVLGWRLKEVTTGTTDQDEAYAKFGDQIREHRELLWLTRNYYDPKLQIVKQTFDKASWKMEPGTSELRDDGSRWDATEDGKHIIVTPIVGRPQVIENEREDLMVLFAPQSEIDVFNKIQERCKKSKRNIDKEIADHWKRGQSSDSQRYLDRFMNVVHEVAPKRTLITLEPRDVRNIVQALFDTGLSTKSVERNFQIANAMINKCIGHEDFTILKVNPFKIKDLISAEYQNVKGSRPKPMRFGDDELKLIADDIHRWKDDERLLWTMLRTMGPRLSEPGQIIGEEIIDGLRCWTYGTKNPKTHRVVPASRAVADLFPNRVTSSGLFECKIHAINQRVMRRLNRLGIERLTGKSAQSLRHMFETDSYHNKVGSRVVDAIMGHVPDDLRFNQHLNKEAREEKSIQYRYFQGCRAQELHDAMNLITTGF